MNIKKCVSCKEIKSFDNFYKNSSKSSGLGNFCKNCSKTYSKSNYHKYKDRQKENKKHSINEKQNVLISLLKNSNGCNDCGSKDIRVLEFDHINDNKYMCVSKLLSGNYKLEVILNEINKCEIVCRNCHAIRTYTRQNSYRVR